MYGKVNKEGKVFTWIVVALMMFGVLTPFLSAVIPFVGIYFLVNFIRNNKMEKTNTVVHNKRVSHLTPYQREKIHLSLKEYFDSNDRLVVMGDISLRPQKGEYTSIRELYVYENEDCVATLDDFQARHRDLYNTLLDLLLEFSNLERSKLNVTSVKKEEPKAKEVVKEPKKASNEFDNAKEYIDVINKLNTAIPHEEISNGLYQICAYLKQIEVIETNFPKSKVKLKKVYQYYLPILIGILENYCQFEGAGEGNEEFQRAEDKLIKTIILINEALKNISTELCQEELMSLNANMSTLEMLLHNDGLIGNKPLTAVKGKGGTDVK